MRSQGNDGEMGEPKGEGRKSTMEKWEEHHPEPLGREPRETLRETIANHFPEEGGEDLPWSPGKPSCILLLWAGSAHPAPTRVWTYHCRLAGPSGTLACQEGIGGADPQLKSQAWAGVRQLSGA